VPEKEKHMGLLLTVLFWIYWTVVGLALLGFTAFGVSFRMSPEYRAVKAEPDFDAGWRNFFYAAGASFVWPLLLVPVVYFVYKGLTGFGNIIAEDDVHDHMVAEGQMKRNKKLYAEGWRNGTPPGGK
jgi:UPF0716 family protein affecting phage T7 exclusion